MKSLVFRHQETGATINTHDQTKLGESQFAPSVKEKDAEKTSQVLCINLASQAVDLTRCGWCNQSLLLSCRPSDVPVGRTSIIDRLACYEDRRAND
ncbi:hypothetical protein PoB_005359600 [Plakobranchus ocellatus]|uniref:Uncharacterized protein n=1 Tax=Plakobranchus ocellatus TaxID=259542 RepID=A0AAV4C6X8_9GAST|nr:hypothetical protein PoB_005359600 [Plakobranchus ocellatus]